MKKARLMVGILLLCLLFGGLADTSFSQINPFGKRVLIGFKDGIGHQSATRRGSWVHNLGGDVHHSFRFLPLVSAKLPKKLVTKLKGRAEIAYVEDDIIMHAIQQETPWGVDRIDAELVWSTNTGAGVDVAILDTGIDYDHPDLVANLAGGVNFTGWWWVDGSTYRYYWNDRNGHGSHNAGIVAAVNNNIGIVGVAPAANLWSVRVLGDNGSGYVSDIIQGLEWCVDNGIEVASMSFGGDYSESLKNACDAAYAAGVLLVAAAGNEYGGAVIYPAAHDSVIAVSAIDNANNIADFSSAGQEVELSAPGVNIKSTYKNGGYALGSGTSMACPHVAGAAALVWSGSNEDVRIRLRETAEDIGLTSYEQGYGLVDAAAAAKISSEPPVLATIEVSPSAVTLFVDETQLFTATGIDQYGDPIDTGTITWQSSNTAVGTISATGLFTAKAEGTTTVSATGNAGISGTASLTVQEAPLLTTIEVSPSAVTLFVDETQQFTATGVDQYGDPIDTGTITWQSSNTTVGTISTNGLLTAVGAGTTTVSATGNAWVYGTASVTVQEAPLLTTIEVSPATVILDVGQTQQFIATGKDQYGDPINTGSITWESSNEAVGIVDSTGLFQALAEGTTTVSAISGQVVGIASVTVQEAPATPTMHVGDISFEADVWSWGRWATLVRVTVIVPLLDSSDAGVDRATIYGSWSGVYNRYVSGSTNSQGTVTFTTGWVFGGGTFTFTVNDVTKAGWTYDSAANVETSDSIIAP